MIISASKIDSYVFSHPGIPYRKLKLTIEAINIPKEGKFWSWSLFDMQDCTRAVLSGLQKLGDDYKANPWHGKDYLGFTIKQNAPHGVQLFYNGEVVYLDD